MEYRKFFGAEDAARYAATITDEWQTEEGERWDVKQLIEMGNIADGENPLDEEYDTDEYYVVDERGALGYTASDCDDIYWWVTPTKVVQVIPEAPAASAAPERRFCPNCGAEAKPGWAFCGKCGHKLG